jgi:hypothetical protein
VSFQPVYPNQVQVREIALDIECLCGRKIYTDTALLIMPVCDCGRTYRIDLSVSVDDGDATLDEERVRTGSDFSMLCGACVSGARHTFATHKHMITQRVEGEPC